VVNLTPLDRITLRATEIKALLAGRGLLNARVVGWAGAGKDFGPRCRPRSRSTCPRSLT